MIGIVLIFAALASANTVTYDTDCMDVDNLCVETLNATTLHAPVKIANGAGTVGHFFASQDTEGTGSWKHIDDVLSTHNVSLANDLTVSGTLATGDGECLCGTAVAVPATKFEYSASGSAYIVAGGLNLQIGGVYEPALGPCTINTGADTTLTGFTPPLSPGGAHLIIELGGDYSGDTCTIKIVGRIVDPDTGGVGASTSTDFTITESDTLYITEDRFWTVTDITGGGASCSTGGTLTIRNARPMDMGKRDYTLTNYMFHFKPSSDTFDIGVRITGIQENGATPGTGVWRPIVVTTLEHYGLSGTGTNNDLKDWTVRAGDRTLALASDNPCGADRLCLLEASDLVAQFGTRTSFLASTRIDGMVIDVRQGSVEAGLAPTSLGNFREYGVVVQGTYD